MGNVVDNKFTWVIKNFSSLQSEKVLSDPFVIGGCKWRLVAYLKGNEKVQFLSVYLRVADTQTLPYGWRRHAKFEITVVDPHGGLSQVKESNLLWFDQDSPTYGFLRLLHFDDMKPGTGGFLLNDELKINVEIEVDEVIGKLDEYEEATQPLKKVKRAESPDLPKEASLVEKSINVNGFRVLRSQVELVWCIFKHQPNMALNFRIENQYLKTAYMNVLLSLIKTLCKSPQLKKELADAYSSLGTMKDAGLELDWLEKKLNEVSEKKEIDEAYETRMQEVKEELKDLKAKVLEARVPFTLEDIFAE